MYSTVPVCWSRRRSEFSVGAAAVLALGLAREPESQSTGNMAEAAEACRAAAGELHDQGLISAALLERISASLRRPSEGVPPAAESAAPEADGGTALALLRESVVSFPIFVRAHLLQDSWAEGPAGGAVMLARLDACSSSYLRGDLEEYKAAVDSLGAELLRSNPLIADGSAGWFQNELTALMEGLVQYYLGSNHWDRPDDVLKANTDDAEVEVSVAAEAASAAMSRSWSRLKRSVWDNAVTNRLSTVREFSTMTDILKSVATDETEDADLAAARRTLRESRPPFIVLLGGGMAAGKSTVVHKLKHEWTGSVVIEADQFKMNGACVLPSPPPSPSPFRVVLCPKQKRTDSAWCVFPGPCRHFFPRAQQTHRWRQ
jgi:hypothetical protein